MPIAGIVAAIALAFVTIRFNLQKWVIIIATSIMGAGVIFGLDSYNRWTATEPVP